MSESVEGEDKLKPEDNLPNWLYILVCFIYLIMVSLAAIFIDDLTLIFGIIAGLAECSTVFILPSIFYLVACNKEDTQHARQKKGGGILIRIGVYIYLCMGLAYFGISNYFNIIKIVRG